MHSIFKFIYYLQQLHVPMAGVGMRSVGMCNFRLYRTDAMHHATDIQRKVSRLPLPPAPLAMEGPRYDDLFSDCDADLITVYH